jgi:hypothetical protein
MTGILGVLFFLPFTDHTVYGGNQVESPIVDMLRSSMYSEVAESVGYAIDQASGGRIGALLDKTSFVMKGFQSTLHKLASLDI